MLALRFVALSAGLPAVLGTFQLASCDDSGSSPPFPHPENNLGTYKAVWDPWTACDEDRLKTTSYACLNKEFEDSWGIKTVKTYGAVQGHLRDQDFDDDNQWGRYIRGLWRQWRSCETVAFVFLCVNAAILGTGCCFCNCRRCRGSKGSEKFGILHKYAYSAMFVVLFFFFLCRALFLGNTKMDYGFRELLTLPNQLGMFTEQLGTPLEDMVVGIGAAVAVFVGEVQTASGNRRLLELQSIPAGDLTAQQSNNVSDFVNNLGERPLRSRVQAYGTMETFDWMSETLDTVLREVIDDESNPGWSSYEGWASSAQGYLDQVRQRTNAVENRPDVATGDTTKPKEYGNLWYTANVINEFFLDDGFTNPMGKFGHFERPAVSGFIENGGARFDSYIVNESIEGWCWTDECFENSIMFFNTERMSFVDRVFPISRFFAFLMLLFPLLVIWVLSVFALASGWDEPALNLVLGGMIWTPVMFFLLGPFVPVSQMLHDVCSSGQEMMKTSARGFIPDICENADSGEAFLECTLKWEFMGATYESVNLNVMVENAFGMTPLDADAIQRGRNQGWTYLMGQVAETYNNTFKTEVPTYVTARWDELAAVGVTLSNESRNTMATALADHLSSVPTYWMEIITDQSLNEINLAFREIFCCQFADSMAKFIWSLLWMAGLIWVLGIPGSMMIADDWFRKVTSEGAKEGGGVVGIVRGNFVNDI